jgi:membrane associated rhomboid family serine protease
MNNEKTRFYFSFVPPLALVLLMATLKTVEHFTGISLGFLGIYPMHTKGLLGILTAPLVHENFDHLFSNIIPLFFMGGLLFYFYRPIAWKTLILIWIFGGLLVWLGGRESWHIGASGVVYGLATFHLLGGVLRKEPKMMAISLLVIFLYGGMIWGVFPDFFPGKNISWEAHLGGLLTGVITAIYYRNQGPQKTVYSWQEDDNLSSEFAWPPELLEKHQHKESEADKAHKMMIKYIYRKRDQEADEPPI